MRAGNGWREAGIDPAHKINDFWGFSSRGERRRAGPCVEGGRTDPHTAAKLRRREVVVAMRAFPLSRHSQGWNLQEEDEGE